MALTDDQLLDFDTNRMAHWEPERAGELLDQQPELYRNHLVIARHVQQWADRLEEYSPGVTSMTPDESFNHAATSLRTCAKGTTPSEELSMQVAS